MPRARIRLVSKGQHIVINGDFGGRGFGGPPPPPARGGLGAWVIALAAWALGAVLLGALMLLPGAPAWAGPAGDRPVGDRPAGDGPAGSKEAGAAREAEAGQVARRPRVGVTSVGALGMPSEAVPSLVSNLAGGLASAGLRVVGPDELKRALGSSGALAGCVTAVCLKKIGELARVPLCARATVEATGTSYRLEVQLTEAATGTVAVKLERRCDVCTIKEVNDALSQAAQEAGRKLPGTWAPPPGSVTGDEPGPGEGGSKGGGAGTRVGARPGTSTSRAGGVPAASGVGKSSGRELTRLDQRLRLWGIVTASASALLLVPGAALLGLNGKVTDGGCGAKKCIYDTAAAGGLTTGLGVAALLAGGALLLYAYLPRKRESHVDVGKADQGPALRFGAGPLLGGGFFQLEGRV